MAQFVITGTIGKNKAYLSILYSHLRWVDNIKEAKIFNNKSEVEDKYQYIVTNQEIRDSLIKTLKGIFPTNKGDIKLSLTVLVTASLDTQRYSFDGVTSKRLS